MRACARKSVLTPHYRDAAREAIASSWVFKPFDPVVVNIFVECALHETPTGEVKLKMPVVHECIAYVDQYCVSEAFELLGKLDDRVELRWVVAGRLSDLCVLYNDVGHVQR